MDIVFLDANVLFSAAYQDKAGLLQLWSLADIKLITSVYAAEEAKRNLKQPEQKKRLEKLLSALHIIATEHSNELIPPKIVLPAKDQPILSAAIASHANYLITGDYRDFGRYYGQNIAGVTILPPAKYFAHYNSKR
jgi:predicted nucleic acid-binding protein